MKTHLAYRVVIVSYTTMKQIHSLIREIYMKTHLQSLKFSQDFINLIIFNKFE